MKYCSETTSRKIAVLTTLATVAVVIVHSNSLESIRTPSWAFWAGNAIAFLQHWAVPFFFMVSGFLGNDFCRVHGLGSHRSDDWHHGRESERIFGN